MIAGHPRTEEEKEPVIALCSVFPGVHDLHFQDQNCEASGFMGWDIGSARHEPLGKLAWLSQVEAPSLLEIPTRPWRSLSVIQQQSSAAVGRLRPETQLAGPGGWPLAGRQGCLSGAKTG